MTRTRAKIRSLLPLLSSLYLLCNTGSAHDTEQLVRERCPGMATWEDQHLKTPAVDPVPDPKLPLLRSQLLAMERQDQEVRDRFVHEEGASAVLQEMMRIDAENLTQLRRIVARYGVPDISKVGRDGISALWLLTQHAGGDVQLQKLVLAKFQKGNYGIDASEIAMLTDRILLAEGRSQLYGTQFHLENGRLIPYRIREQRSVDARRAKMGLMPLDDYQCALNASERPEASK